MKRGKRIYKNAGRSWIVQNIGRLSPEELIHCSYQLIYARLARQMSPQFSLFAIKIFISLFPIFCTFSILSIFLLFFSLSVYFL